MPFRCRCSFTPPSTMLSPRRAIYGWCRFRYFRCHFHGAAYSYADAYAALLMLICRHADWCFSLLFIAAYWWCRHYFALIMLIIFIFFFLIAAAAAMIIFASCHYAIDAIDAADFHAWCLLMIDAIIFWLLLITLSRHYAHIADYFSSIWYLPPYISRHLFSPDYFYIFRYCHFWCWVICLLIFIAAIYFRCHLLIIDYAAGFDAIYATISCFRWCHFSIFIFIIAFLLYLPLSIMPPFSLITLNIITYLMIIYAMPLLITPFIISFHYFHFWYWLHLLIAISPLRHLFHCH